MNEKIKQLVKQAEQYALDRANEGSDEDYDYAFDDDFRQKFAELIVQECLDQLHVNDWDEDYDKGVYWSREQIKNHFGAES